MSNDSSIFNLALCGFCAIAPSLFADSKLAAAAGSRRGLVVGASVFTVATSYYLYLRNETETLETILIRGDNETVGYGTRLGDPQHQQQHQQEEIDAGGDVAAAESDDDDNNTNVQPGDPARSTGVQPPLVMQQAQPATAVPGPNATILAIAHDPERQRLMDRRDQNRFILKTISAVGCFSTAAFVFCALASSEKRAQQLQQQQTKTNTPPPRPDNNNNSNSNSAFDFRKLFNDTTRKNYPGLVTVNNDTGKMCETTTSAVDVPFPFSLIPRAQPDMVAVLPKGEFDMGVRYLSQMTNVCAIHPSSRVNMCYEYPTGRRVVLSKHFDRVANANK